MDVNSIPDAFQSKIRLAIISSLLTGTKTFNEIKDLTQATDGNLSGHLTKLEETGYLDVKKEFVSKKPQTTFTLTSNGRKEFEEYVKLLECLLKNSSV